MNVLQSLVRMAEHAQILQEATLVLVPMVGKDSIVIKVDEISYNFFCIFLLLLLWFRYHRYRYRNKSAMLN